MPGTTQTRTQDMTQHIRLLDDALSMNLYYAAKILLNYVLEDIEVLEVEAELWTNIHFKE